MNSGKKFCLLILLFLMAAFAYADGIKPLFGLDTFDLIYLRLYTGIGNFNIVPDVESQVRLYFGGGYLGDSYYRDLSGDRLYDPGYAFDGTAFNIIDLDAKLGLDLGLLYSETLNRNWLFNRFYIITRYEYFVQESGMPSILSQTGFADKDGFWQTSLFLSLQLDTMELDMVDDVKKGMKAELAFEWTPGISMNEVYGDASFVRIDANFSGFIPIMKKDHVAMYFGDRFMVDCLFGNKIPTYAQREIGGFDKDAATGGAVRGIDKTRYDANLKFVNNIDIRLTFPRLIHERIIPEIFAFFDMALMDDLDYELSSFAKGLYTTGIGVFINSNLFNFCLDAGWYVSYDFREGRLNPLNIKLGAHQF